MRENRIGTRQILKSQNTKHQMTNLNVRKILTFYKSFVFVSSVITLTCVSAININGLEILTAVLLFKLFTLGIIILYINLYKKNEFYYYHNLGLSKLTLWIYTSGIDLLLFFLSIAVLLWAK
jgi:hypothetical protein